MQQCFLFNVEAPAPSPREMDKGKIKRGKRGKYKPRKPKPFNVYAELNKLQQDLFVALGGDIFYRGEEKKEERNGIIYYYGVYDEGCYIYEGELQRGESFRIYEAELSGVQGLSAEERYFLISAFFFFLRSNSPRLAVQQVQILTELAIIIKDYSLFLFFIFIFLRVYQNGENSEYPLASG